MWRNEIYNSMWKYEILSRNDGDNGENGVTRELYASANL